MPIKNMNDIRSLLSDEIDRLVAKETTPSHLHAITNATGKIIATVKLELEAAKLANKKPNNGFIQLEDTQPVQAPA